MKKVFFLFLTSVLVVTYTQAQYWKPVSGTINFSIKMLGLNVNGKLGGIKANLGFTNNEPSEIYASAESNTIDTNNSLRDSHLKEKPEFFEPVKYPQIRMKSKSIYKSGNNYIGIFDVTLKNITKVIKVPFSFTENGNSGTFKGKYTLDRDDFKFGGNTLGMSDDVKVSITLNVKK